MALALSVLLYAQQHAGWGRFALLLLAPDLAMLGYLFGARTGTAVYHVVHTYVLPLLLAAWSMAGGPREILPYCLIWAAHIGMDRMLGFGLKYPSAFRDTHLQRLA